MENILIIGARGFGREICGGLMRKPFSYNKKFKIKGFLDDNKEALDGFSGFPPIVSSVEDYEIKKKDVFVCALGNAAAREKYIEIIKNKGGRFITLIKPNSIICNTAEIGEGVYIGDFCRISENTRISDFSLIHGYSTVAHDVQIGKYCVVQVNSFLGGYVKVGDRSTLHTRTTVIPGVTIGENAVTGAGSVVLKDVPSGITVFGVPAKKMMF